MATPQTLCFSKTFATTSTTLGRKQDINILFQVFAFRADWKTKMALGPLIFWDIFGEVRWIGCLTSQSTIFQSYMWRHIDVQANYPPPLGPHGGKPFSTDLNSLHGIQRNVVGSKLSTSSTKNVFFRPIENPRWPQKRLIGWDIFDFSSKIAERNSKKIQ